MATTELSETTDPNVVVNDSRRTVALEAVHNFRDLGGYQMADGRTIGWGRLFRADGLHRLTANDLDVMDAIGISTVVDLRSPGEAEMHGSYPVERHPVAFHSLPIIDITWRDSDTPDVDDTEDGAIEFLTWAYGDMLDQGADRFAHAIKLLAVPGTGAAVFHCAAGKDRTGVLAALILGGLGVNLDAIVADYALTAAGMDRLRQWVGAQDPAMADLMASTPSYMLSAHPQAIRNTVDGIIAEHGSIPNYLSMVGVGAAVLDELATTLTD